MKEKVYDIVIIGSGAGGGTVAKELGALAASGARVALLEWGPELTAGDYTGRELDMARKLYVDSGGLLTRDGTLTLAMGRALGGSTVVYTGTSLVMPERVVNRWAVPGLHAEDLQRRSHKYLEENNVHLQDERDLNENNLLFAQACRRLGYGVHQFPINVKDCKGSSLCNLGCPHGAKQGTHRVQIPEARRRGVEVVTHCRVTHIGDRWCEALVRPWGYGYPSAWEPGIYKVRAKVIVVCCGAVHSPALLLRSRLPVDLPALGRYLTLHPALILVGEHPRPITNFYGHPKSFYCDHFMESHRFLLETCMYFPFTTAKNLIGFGPQHSRMMHRMDRMQMILALALDPALPENRVRVDRRGTPVVDYRLTPPVLDSLHEAMKASARIFFEAGAVRVHAPAGRIFSLGVECGDRLDHWIPRRKVQPGRISVSSAHLMGGCRMGTSPSDSVTDGWGQVHGVPWLFVADSSLFPRCSEVNPYITVMALADRVAEGIRQRSQELCAS
ncbi:Choline dehydrogenase [Desulfacinum hydrothermale DSM 13146]|uniref:Choline dehydrogenase n=1 Tax=Desulfacinum hydrothermale DSM 13146 TaxID=1121390 RepID=A0A1W1WX88_9BACT|nr:GMC family oxidoreductase [Desulfacinum hydrothermale]SMC16254.1 Choline dehydrogenase [Desulfacinum hydrothermale DSM 13146]